MTTPTLESRTMPPRREISRNPEAWLLAKLGARYLTYLRSHRARLYEVVDSAILELLAGAPDQEQLELKADLDSLLSQLPDRCRSILRLRYGLLAEGTEVRASGLRELMSRCLAMLGERLLGTLFRRQAPVSDLYEAVVRIWPEPGNAQQKVTDPPDDLERFVWVPVELRAASGRLSARKVAATFNLSLAEISRLTGRSRQAVSKTSDAGSLQAALAPFERVARLRGLLAEGEFLRWLRMPNDQLGGQSPLDVMRGGRAADVADLAEDMLTGNVT